MTEREGEEFSNGNATRSSRAEQGAFAGEGGCGPAKVPTGQRLRIKKRTGSFNARVRLRGVVRGKGGCKVKMTLQPRRKKGRR